MADTKLSALPSIATGDIDNSVLIYCVDVTGGNISSKVTRSALYLAIANVFTTGQTISSVTNTGLVINPSTTPVGSASAYHSGLSIAAGTVAFATTAQTGDYSTSRIDQATLTNPSLGTITNATSLKIIGPPIASTNVTITNAYSLWVAGGTTLLQATTIATTLLVQGQTTHTTTTNTAVIINTSSAPTGSGSEFIGRLSCPTGTTGFLTTAQTGDFVGVKLDQATLTNPSLGTITNASTLKIVGAPIASTNVTITNVYSLWIAGGNVLFAGNLTVNGTTIFNNAITVTRIQNTLQTGLGTTGALNLDFTANEITDLGTITGNITFTTSNTSGGRSKTIIVLGDGTHSVTINAAWKYSSGSPSSPITPASGKYLIITLTVANNGDIVAASTVTA